MNGRSSWTFFGLVVVAFVIGFCHPANAAIVHDSWETVPIDPPHDSWMNVEISPEPDRDARPPSVPVPARASLPPPASVEVWRQLVAAYFPLEEVDRALRVIACESGGDPTIVNPSSGASGLFQHMARYWPERAAQAGWAGADVLDPTANVAVAAWLFSNPGEGRPPGWWHWECQP